MTTNEKVAKVIEYLSCCPAETVVERLYKQLENDGIFDDKESDDMPAEMELALDYVRENMDADDMAILKANVNKCYNMHLVPGEGVMDCSQLIDLLEEYGEEHDLPEGWWEEYDIDEFLTRL